jgi:hypothetical protein
MAFSRIACAERSVSAVVHVNALTRFGPAQT